LLNDSLSPKLSAFLLNSVSNVIEVLLVFSIPILRSGEGKLPI